MMFLKWGNVLKTGSFKNVHFKEILECFNDLSNNMSKMFNRIHFKNVSYLWSLFLVSFTWTKKIGYSVLLSYSFILARYSNIWFQASYNLNLKRTTKHSFKYNLP